MAEINVTIIDKIKYKIPVIKITTVRFTQINTPHPIGSCFVIKIKINIIGIINMANFFQTLKTCSEKNKTNNNDVEINRGVKTNVEANSLKNTLLHKKLLQFILKRK